MTIESRAARVNPHFEQPGSALRCGILSAHEHHGMITDCNSSCRFWLLARRIRSLMDSGAIL